MSNDFPVTLADIELRRDLVKAGWTDRDIATHVRRGELTKVRYGAYVRSLLLAEMDAVALMRVQSRAVLRTAHATSVLSHQAALAEWDVPLWAVSLAQVDLTRSDGKAGRRESGVVHHRGTLTEDEWSIRNGVPVVDAARAVIEVMVSHSTEVGLVAACGALTRGRVTPDSLQAAASRAERWPNSLHLRIVLARADRRLTSVAEARTWHLFHDHHIPRPEL